MFSKAFIHKLEKTAIVDRFGELSYTDLSSLVEKYSHHFKARSCCDKRILIEGGNHGNLVAMIIALMDNNNEVILQEPKATTAETNTLIKTYKINGRMNADIDNPVAGLPDIQWREKDTHIIPVAMIYYFSSGSTGMPKLFGYTAERLVALLRAWTTPFGQDESFVVMCPLTITHFHGTMVCFSALMYGNKLVFSNTDQLDTRQIIQLMDTHLPTLISATPYLYQKLYGEIPEHFSGLEQLRYAICGSAPMSAMLSENYHRKYGFYLMQGYGLSEIGAICFDLHPEKGLGTVGAVLPGISYKIIDEQGNVVAPGEEGELVVQAPYMATEYLDAPEMTREMFKDNWLHTKDIVVEDDMGRITILGRKSTFINIAGFKVFPVEIEKTIMSFHPNIAVAVQDKMVNGKPVITAYIETSTQINLAELKAYCEKNLAKYKQPGEYILVESLPKNMIGKVRYKQLE